MDNLFTIGMLALATAPISVTITQGGIFSDVRKWIADKNTWLGKLFSCPYCISHWVAIVLVCIYRPILISYWYPLDLVISIFVVIAMSAVVIGIITKLISFQNDWIEEVKKMREALRRAKEALENRRNKEDV